MALADEEIEALKDMCRWLAKNHMQWHRLRHEALSLAPAECKEFLKGKFPIIQGTGNHLNLKKIGEKPVKTENLNKAVKILLED
jgi:hypothetical protein